MIDSNYIKQLFQCEPSQAILQCQKHIAEVANFPTYQDFVRYHEEHAQTSICQNEWNTPIMAIHCFQCSIDPQSCLCLECFLNGNHQGHDYIIRPDSVGNCDCGDTSLWKREGYCKEHSGLAEKDSRPQDYLDEKLQTLLSDVIFKGIFDALQILFLDSSNQSTVSAIFQFLTSFLKFGDGFRRLIVIALTEKTDFKSLITNVVNYCEEYNQLFEDFAGKLINDRLFAINFANNNYDFFIETIYPNSLKSLKGEFDDSNYAVWDHIWFHNFSRQPSEYNILTRKWDWVSFCIKFLQIFKGKLSLFGNNHVVEKTSTISGETINAFKLLTSIDCIEHVQNFLDRISSEILSTGSDDAIAKGTNDSIIVSSHHDQTLNNAYRQPLLYSLYFSDFFDGFKNKPQLKFDTFVQQASEHCDISSIFIKDKVHNNSHELISKYVNETQPTEGHEHHYRSFHNGAAYFYLFPYYDALVQLFRTDSTNRFKLGQLFLQEQYQDIRIKLLIVALKKMLSITLLQQSVIRRRCNSGLDQVLAQNLDNQRFASFSNTQQYPLIQLLLGLQNKNNPIDHFSLKEFFAFEMARETGIFDYMISNENNEEFIEDLYPGQNKVDEYKDENVSELMNTMLLSYIYHLLVITIERTLFNFNAESFIQEQVIYQLSKKASSIDFLSERTDRNILEDYRDMSLINSVIQRVAIKAKQKNSNMDDEDGSSITYALKPGFSCNTISGINPFGELLAMIDNSISKNSDKLYQIQDFESEDTYFFKDNKDIPKNDEMRISLKDLLLTPTVLSIMYHTLRLSVRENKSKATSKDHLAMNILLLAYKCASENKSAQTTLDTKTVIRYRSIYELVNILRILAFNFKEDSTGNATVANTMNEVTFKQLLNLKISYLDEEPQSFIDLIMAKGEVGNDLLTQMSFNLARKTENEQKDIIKEKKARAILIKANIMKQYKDMIATSNVLEQEEMMPEEPEQETCSICSTNKEDEMLSYPIYMYRTKLPFIFDKPPLSVGSDIELEVDSSIDEIDPHEQPMPSDNEEEEDNEILTTLQLRRAIKEDLGRLEARIQEQVNSGEISPEAADTYRQIGLQFLQQKYQDIQERQRERELSREMKANQLKAIEKRKALLKSFEERKDQTPVPRMYTCGLNYIMTFVACQHLMHPSCSQNENFTCPIDRSCKNGFIPCFDAVPKQSIVQSTGELTVPAKNSIENFLNQFVKQLQIGIDSIDIFTELIKSISGLICTYEMRLRTLPSCLDSKKVFVLSRNLFLTVWYAYRMRNKPKIINKKPFPLNKENIFIDEDVEKEMTQFQRFVKRLIECDQIDDPNTFNSIVAEFVNSPVFSTSSNAKRRDKELCLFLRRVCLSKHFLLGQDVSGTVKGFVDWDETLSVPELIAQFNAKFPTLNEDEEFDFKSFTFGPLHKEFLRLSQPPYELPIKMTQEFNFYMLVDYNYLITNYNDFDDVESVKVVEPSPEIHQSRLAHANTSYFLHELAIKCANKNYPVFYLAIGKLASAVIAVEHGKLSETCTFYFDKYGCPDIGYSRGQPLFFRDDQYEKLVDAVLSGEYTNSLRDI